MAIKLLIGTEDVPQLANQIDDDNGSWWGGTRLAGAGLALAGALVATALTTGLAQQVATQQQDELASNLASPIDEDYWPQPVPATPQTLARQTFIDEEIGTQLTFSPEEDSWTVTVPQPQATVYQQPWAYQPDEAPLATSLDEDYWPQPLPSQPATLAQVIYDQDEAIQAQVVQNTIDEDYWFQVIPVPPTQVAQPWFHQDEVFPATSFSPEEDYWPHSSQVGNSYLARIFQDEGDLIGTPIVVATSTATDPEIHLFKLNYTNKMHKL